jgi:hypothetical protein
MVRFSLSLIRPGDGNKLYSSKCNRKLFVGGTPNIATAGLALGCVVISGSLIAMLSSLHSQTPAEDVAAQIRSQGYQCDQPVTARRNVRLSKPDSAVWTLKCRNATYRVRLDPDMKAHVVKLKE